MKIGNDWDELLAPAFAAESYTALRAFLADEYAHHTVYPAQYDVFNALKLTPYAAVRCCILGQDPYHGEGQAHGLAFSVRDGVPKPPSLVNIFKEINDELGIPVPDTGDLTPWAERGVLLLNTVLTVRAGLADSHKKHGWEQFTDSVIRLLDERTEPIVFLLWGGNARRKAEMITNRRHLVLQCAHPSPLSAYNGFFGCGHFIRTNDFLIEHGREPIDWSLT
ncbi:MAG: uracil-DNA glycosylase [Eubacteriales bacterium]|nr:uracil-DNA glycosylase [Eubacteriales bacterium]